MRQTELNECHTIVPDIEKGIYPFKGMKLSRADVEWLLATHENGRGPVDWSDESQHLRTGLNLSGTDLRGVDLSNLPLARMQGTLSWDEWRSATDNQREDAAIHLEGSKIISTHLEGTFLMNAHLEKAYLRDALLNTAQLNKAHLEGATVNFARLENAILHEAHLEDINGYGVHLEGAYLGRASLTGAKLNFAHLENAVLLTAHLEKTELKGTHLEGANIAFAHLEGAILREAFFDRATQLDDIVLNNKHDGCVSLADVRWGDVNLAVVNWSQVDKLGDEQEAKQKRQDGKMKDQSTRLTEHERAVRAYRQLAVVLQSQNLNEDATRFVYRSQVLQKSVWWFRMLK